MKLSAEKNDNIILLCSNHKSPEPFPDTAANNSLLKTNIDAI
jgi:hypothetical protein